MRASAMMEAGPGPRISGSRWLTVRTTREALLLWVRTGTTEVRDLDHGWLITAGQALWIPAGATVRLRTLQDSVAFPILVAPGQGSADPGRVVRISVPEEWNDWLLHQFARSIGYLRGDSAPDPLLDVDAALPVPPSGDPRPAGPVPHPHMPVSPEASAIAGGLLHRPDDPCSTAEHAASVGVSVRTLQEQFARETGLPFARWRTALRVAVAAGLLDAGRSVREAGARVGFETPAGFTRAFRARIGISPRSYRRARGVQRHGPSRPSPARPSEVELGARLPFRLMSEAAPWPEPPSIPAASTWQRVNDFHVVVCMPRGSGVLTIGEEHYRMGRGDVAWLPAGQRNHISLARGSLLIPLGSCPADAVPRPPERLLLSMGSVDEDRLLHSFVANYTRLSPADHDPRAITREFLRWTATVHRPAAQEARVARVIQIVAADPADRRGLAEWSRETGVPARALGRGIHEATGQGFHAWRSGLRMTAARKLLEERVSVAQAARRLGYSGPDSFSAVFARAHGISPSKFRATAWGSSREDIIVR